MRRLEASHPYCSHRRAHERFTDGWPQDASPASDRVANRCLIPFNRREGLTTAEAAERANRTERTIRMWCRDHDIGRRVAGGPWLVSRVALAMFLNDDAPALQAYLAGDRRSPSVAVYFAAEGLEELSFS